MKLRLVSNGHADHTQLIDVETGENLLTKLQVSEIEWVCSATDSRIATVRLHLCVSEVDLIGDTDIRAARAEARVEQLEEQLAVYERSRGR